MAGYGRAWIVFCFVAKLDKSREQYVNMSLVRWVFLTEAYPVIAEGWEKCTIDTLYLVKVFRGKGTEGKKIFLFFFLPSYIILYQYWAGGDEGYLVATYHTWRLRSVRHAHCTWFSKLIAFASLINSHEWEWLLQPSMAAMTGFEKRGTDLSVVWILGKGPQKTSCEIECGLLPSWVISYVSHGFIDCPNR